jgi:hypothetical protein
MTVCLANGRSIPKTTLEYVHPGLDTLYLARGRLVRWRQALEQYQSRRRPPSGSFSPRVSRVG